jgi:hypothetical protein
MVGRISVGPLRSWLRITASRILSYCPVVRRQSPPLDFTLTLRRVLGGLMQTYPRTREVVCSGAGTFARMIPPKTGGRVFGFCGLGLPFGPPNNTTDGPPSNTWQH